LQFDIAFQMVLASRRFRARFAERVKSRGQTDSRWSALYMLSQHPEGLIQSELAELMGVQGPTLVRLLDALQENRLVSRHPAPGDRRANRIVIEEAGRQILLEIDAVASKLREEVFRKIPDEDLQVTLRSLELLSKSLEHARS
jgi:MarR family transcriptional regulator for hemolysin